MLRKSPLAEQIPCWSAQILLSSGIGDVQIHEMLEDKTYVTTIEVSRGGTLVLRSDLLRLSALL